MISELTAKHGSEYPQAEIKDQLLFHELLADDNFEKFSLAWFYFSRCACNWTGSISEGITIAFDGMKRATVIGTQLARLNGAVDGFEMPNTKIGVNIATEKLYHVNGTPREFYNPAILVDVSNQEPGNDVILHTAIKYLHAKTK